MLGQLWVDPALELPELEPDELDDPELVLPELDDDGVVVDELVLELEPVAPVLEVPVVAASATSAPPVTRPAVSALIANTFRSLFFMVVVLPFVRCAAPFRSGSHTLRPGPVAGRTTTAWCWLRFPTIR
jgi:hypothetical protein